MQYDFTNILSTLKHEPIKQNGENVTYEEVIVSCLLGNDPQQDAGEKYQCYKLAQKINTNPSVVNIESTDVVLIKKMVGMYTGPLVMGRVWDFLEGVNNG